MKRTLGTTLYGYFVMLLILAAFGLAGTSDRETAEYVQSLQAAEAGK